MRRFLVALAVVLTAGSCASGDDERVVQVDYRNDEFPSHYWRFFPHEVDAHPGDTVIFRQQWTGEPHTVSFGRLVDRAIPRAAAVERKYADLPDEFIPQAEREYAAATKGLPQLDPYQDAAAQGAQQPCYLRRGVPPKGLDKPCTQTEQPEFDGRFAFYSSGFVPPSGASGNSYRVKLAEDIEPGRYRFYCVIHFPFMQGQLVVKPEGSPLRSADTLNRQARKEIRELSDPLERTYDALREGKARYEGEVVTAPSGGFHAADEFTVAIDAFVPKTITTPVGKPVTWTIVGAHTVSFGVPKYLPIYIVRKDGTVRRNPKVDKPAGGSPRIQPVDFARHKDRVDGGTYDGSGFFSSGLIGSEPYATYTLRFTKPGRYRYACLVHPPMVGTVIVRR